ncbi:30S ribosome-binding factor RbfA [Mesoaciditoga lauensis]|uniref:30S ribosome-binding factor RbfA n=1 Tax=Mesoaciditoga lauensis TaxID=1495039 RepID=UPI00055E5F4A|nr:30S ribosome-binding factor RbfA [Mesoaciditoga lauensis]
MGMYRREMMESEIMQVLSTAVRNMKDPRLEGIVSVTRVELSKDLRYAKVYISVFENDEEKRKEVFNVIEKAKGYLKTQVAKNIRTFKAPEITLIDDRGIENAFEMEKLFKKIKKDEKRDSESK